MQRIFSGVGSHSSVGLIDYVCMSITFFLRPMVGEVVHWLFGFNCLIRRLLCIQSTRLKANMNLRTSRTNKCYEYESQSILTNVTMTWGRTRLWEGLEG